MDNTSSGSSKPLPITLPLMGELDEVLGAGTLQISIKDLTTLIINLANVANNPDTAHLSAGASYLETLSILNKWSVQIPVNLAEDLLYSANIQDELGEFVQVDKLVADSTPDPLAFTKWLRAFLDLNTIDKQNQLVYDRFYNLLLLRRNKINGKAGR